MTKQAASLPSANRILTRGRAPAIAYNKIERKNIAPFRPEIVFIHGFMSDRQGTKAMALENWCAKEDYAYLRFDCRGHGESEAAFTDGTIGLWIEDTLDVIDELCGEKVLLVGSSMGGWLALAAALKRPEKVAGVIGLAAAPDFTEDLMWDTFSEEEKEKLLREGLIQKPSGYEGSYYQITKELIEDGRRQMLLRDVLPLSCPVSLIQGMNDVSVPWQTAVQISEKIPHGDVEMHFLKEADHGLSRPEDLTLLYDVIQRMALKITI